MAQKKGGNHKKGVRVGQVFREGCSVLGKNIIFLKSIFTSLYIYPNHPLACFIARFLNIATFWKCVAVYEYRNVIIWMANPFRSKLNTRSWWEWTDNEIKCLWLKILINFHKLWFEIQ